MFSKADRTRYEYQQFEEYQLDAQASGSPSCAAADSLSSVDVTRLGIRKNRGFTLVELIAVIVIIGILASVVAFRTRSYLLVSKQNAAKLDVSRIMQAVDSYYATHDRYPNNEEGLDVLTKKDEAFADGILKTIPLDPWKRPYQYNSPGVDSAYEIICLGADGREGGEGADRDISSEDLDRRSK